MQAQIFTFVIPAIALIFAVVLGLLWRQRRDQLHVLAYSYCFASIAAGVLVNIWIMGAIGLIGMVAYHLISMSGVIAMMWGTSHRVGQKVPIGAYSATVIIACILLAIASSANDIATMKLVQNTGSAILMALAAQNLWHAKKRHLADHALVWVLAMFAGFGLIRPILTDLSIVLFGEGEYGIALLTSIHALILTVMITLMALCLISSVIADNMAEQRRRAEIDPLSGLRIRSSFEDEANLMVERAQNAGVPISMIIADIDHFKHINDQHGHLVGDKVIAAVGDLIRKAIRPKDIAGRLGGEEFGIVLWNCDADAAAAMANRIRLQFHEIGEAIDEASIRCSASFGVEAWPKHMDYTSVFASADASLYRAKNNGRDRVVGAQGELDISSNDHGSYPLFDDRSNVIAIPSK